MELSKLLKPGDKVWLEVLAGNYKGSYPSVVEGVNRDAIVVGHPFIKSALLPLAHGTKVRVTFKGRGALYTFESRVKGRGSEGVFVLYLELPEKIDRIQRRRFVRLEVILPFYYKKDSEERYKSGMIKDISGSGVRAVVDRSVNVGDTLQLFIDLYGKSNPNKVVDVSGVIAVRAVVVRQVINPDFNDKRKKEVGMEFVEMSEKDRQKIVRFIFEKERLSRQKGLL